MYHWTIHVDTLTPLDGMPRVVTVASETQSSPAYHHEGRYRQREQSYILFKYTLSGEGIFRDAGGEHRVSSGTGFLCEIRDPATAYYYPDNGLMPWTFLYVCMSGQATRAMAHELISRYGPVYSLPRDGGIIADLLRFGDLKGPNLELSAVDAGRLATDLLFSLLQSRSAMDTDSQEAGLVRRALALMDQRVTSRLTATEVAAELKISREHFTRVFTAHMRMSPYQHILHRKIRLACYLLKEGRLTAKEVAARVGFSEAAHFNRAFRSITHLTPREFRSRGIMPV